MRILIIRHGDPDYENDTLTEKGKREATLLAQRLKKEKIDAFYTSPLGRAKDTCLYSARACGRENDVVVKDWLQEFNHPLTLASGRKRNIPWDMLPTEWTEEKKMYDAWGWHKQKCYRKADMKAAYDYVANGLDELLQENGYVREGNRYRVETPNTKTIALFCHFGLEMVLMSRLCNISPIPLWHHFTALTSSVTTIFSEERRKGVATFRCAGFGDIGHLYAGEEEPSFSARFCEVFDSEDRHD
ncbi:MAG: histidine phosphatase family protein [Clostridiales bacterium]|nr:histidine phosphatase family protein [Clostridiales bacterium]